MYPAGRFGGVAGREACVRSGRVFLSVALSLLILIPVFSSINCTGEKIVAPETMAFLLSQDQAPYRFNTLQNVSIPGASRFDLYFTEPGTNNTNGVDPVLDDALVALLNSAANSIDIAVYDFDRQIVINALIAAKNRGVTVRMVGDGDNTADAGYAQLASAGIPIVNRPAGSAIMHDKFAIVDSRYLWTGSTNISDHDVLMSNNNALILDSSTMAAAYRAEFNEMYTGGRFGPAKNDVLTSNTTTVNTATIEYYTGPKEALINQLLAKTAAADISIHFMIFTFTRDDLRTAIMARKAAGVKVMGVFDQLQGNGAYSQDDAMAAAGAATWIDGNNHSDGQGGGIMHHKVMIIDGNSTSDPMVITGSTNWTDAANSDNDENLVVIHSADAARYFLQEFCAVVSVATIHPSYTGSTDTGCGGKVFINEALPNPAGVDTNEEYVEIVNTGIGSLNIAGWKLEAGGVLKHTFPSGYSLPMNSVTVVYSSGSHGTIPGAVNASTGGLGLVNTGGTITLKDSVGNVMSSFTYGTNTEGTSVNRSPDLAQTGAVANHSAVTGASGLLSPGKRADQTAYSGVGAVSGPTTPAPAAGDLVITQFATRGSLSASDEFVEVYNRTDHAIDAAGIRIQYQTAACGGWSDRYVLPYGTVLQTGQYFLAVNPGGYISPASGPAGDGSLSTSGFADSGHVRLANASTVELDRVSYGSGLSCFGEGNTAAPNHGTTANAASVVRKPGSYTNAYPAQDTNSNSSDFSVKTARLARNSSVTEPSFGVVKPAAGELLISQFTSRGALNASDEFVEIYNNSNRNLTIDGVKIQYQTSGCTGWSDRLTVPAGVTLAPGQFYLAVNPGGYVSPASGPAGDGLMSTSGFADSAMIRLLSATAAQVDLVAYGTGLTCLGEGNSAAPNHGTAVTSTSVTRKPGDIGSVYSKTSPILDANSNLSDFGLRSARAPRNRSSTAQPSR